MVENFFFIRWRCCSFCGIVTCLFLLLPNNRIHAPRKFYCQK